MVTEQLNRGLRNVYLDRTESSYIDGEQGVLLYRGYNIHDLATKSSFEEVCYLLLHGSLPTREELDAFDRRLRRQRPIAPEVMETIRLNAKAHPMDVLRTAVSSLATYDPDTGDMSREANVRKSERLTAQVATVVAAHDRIRNGKEPLPPREDLAHAANFLYMLGGDEPGAEAVACMDLDFILHAEHGANASAFAGRVTASTEADLHGAIVSAIATLKGPLHGGAAEAVMKMVLEIGTPDKAKEYVEARQPRIMGFGHRVYKAEDPRARHMREKSRELSQRIGKPEWYQILQAVEEAMAPYRRRGIYVNVDFYAGSVYYLLGIPEDLFVPMFAIGRMPGWCTEILEQYDNNILIRPLLKYTGPMDVEYVPIAER